MSRLVFPPVSIADETGLIGIGGTASVENLLEAYSQGIFPWPWSDEYIAWFSPPLRGILYFQDLHISRSLKKILKHHQWTFAINKNFRGVISACAKVDNRTDQKGTWITAELIDGYCSLHDAGHAVSYEAYNGDTLVGGLYGVRTKNYFSGESMFYSEDNASKAVLVYAVEHLVSQNVTWMDCQVVTPTTQQFGAIEIKRNSFLKELKKALK